jgi:U2 small nuclear ribonucleoprotein A'
LVLAQNQLGELGDLDVLGRWARLTHLVLLDNPVTKKEVSAEPGEVRVGRRA